MSDKLPELLAACGLNATEQMVFACLARGSSLPAGRIATLTRLKRPTVYGALEGLLRWGLIAKEQRSGVTQFSACSARTVAQILEDGARKKFDTICDASKLIEKELSDIHSSPRVVLGNYKISTLESYEAVLAQLEQVLTQGNFCAIFNPQIALVGESKSVVERFLQESGDHSGPIREIAVAGPLADWYLSQRRSRQHEIKLLPPDTKVSSDIILTDGTVVISHYPPSPEIAIRISHHDYYQSMLAVFDALWNTL